MIVKRDGLPEHISDIWDEIVQTVDERIGSAGMEALCGCIHTLREAEERVMVEGIVIGDAKGNPCPHPAIQIAKNCQSEVRAWVKEFGVIPKKSGIPW